MDVTTLVCCANVDDPILSRSTSGLGHLVSSAGDILEGPQTPESDPELHFIPDMFPRREVGSGCRRPGEPSVMSWTCVQCGPGVMGGLGMDLAEAKCN